MDDNDIICPRCRELIEFCECESMDMLEGDEALSDDIYETGYEGDN